MLAQATKQMLVDNLDGRARLDQEHKNCFEITVSSQDLPQVVQQIVKEYGGRFIVSIGTDRRENTGCFEVSYVFGLDEQKTFLVLRTEVEPSRPEVPSITNLIPGANWAELEVRDMLGIEPVGHPNPHRLVLPDDWPEGVHPLRRDFRYDSHPEQVERREPRRTNQPADTTILPIGPFFPTLEEPVFFNLFVHGEQIKGMDYRGFYNHRGVEKLADSELTYHQVPYLAERICGICGFVHSNCYCQAVEEAAGIEIPARARYLRTILLELERVHSHLLWIGLACHFIGFDTLFMQAWRIREPVMWLAEQITGNRKTYGTVCIGGVSRDLTVEALQLIPPAIDRIEAEALAVVDAILGDSSLHYRLMGTGILPAEDARALCVVGPTARGSGLTTDARRDHPFAAYDEIEFEVCVEQGCDNWARTMVRIRELLESIKILRQAIQQIPSGPVCADVRQIEPGQVGVSSVEAPRGEVHHYILTGEGNRPHRWRVRAPSYNNLQSIPTLLNGMTISDAPISIGSVDPCFSCTERLGVIDRQAGTVRIYTQDELLRECAGKG